MADYGKAWGDEQLAAPHAAPDKAARVRRMFDAIAPRYELVNHLFSFGRDKAWRRVAVQMARVRPDDDVLDIACGTGDFARAFAATQGAARPRRVVGCDFAHQMLVLAAAHSTTDLHWVEADALALPFRDESFSITSCAFGVRNFQDLDAGLREMRRVLRPGGRAVILEFTRPGRALMRGIYELYANRFMPVAASLVSGDRTGAYHYLPRSVESFLSAEQMCARLRGAGFARVEFRPLTFGVVTVYVAHRDRA